MSDNAQNGSINRTVLSEQIRERMIEDILKGEYRPGDKITGNMIAKKLDVSLAPVREAIRELVIMGYLQSESFKGISVRSFSEQELWEVYELRDSIESMAARKAAERFTPEDERRLCEIMGDLQHAAEQGDVDAFIRLDNQFHEAVLRISGNNLALHIWKTLLFGNWTITAAKKSAVVDLMAVAKSHEDVVDALKSGDPARAEESMKCHIEHLGKPERQSVP